MGIFQTIINKYKDTKQKSFNKKDFKQALLRAVNDGKLTKEEIEELNKKKKDFGLLEEDVKEMKSEIFAAAFAVAKSDEQITKDEEQELLGIQKYLGLADDEIQSSKKELARLRLLNEIQQGNMPTIKVTNLIMQKGEKAYWSEPAWLIEEKVLQRRHVGSSQGGSFRIMKGISYRIGGYSGYSFNETGNVIISEGELVITNKRIVYRGVKKSFGIKLDKILDTEFYLDGLKFSQSNRENSRLVKFIQKGNNDIIGTILSYAINHYGDKE